MAQQNPTLMRRGTNLNPSANLKENSGRMIVMCCMMV